MHIINASTSDQITKQLSLLLGFDISQVQEAQEDSLPGAICKVSVVDRGQVEHHYMLKRQDDDRAYCFYQQYLEPYALNSPKEHGYIELDGLRFLVMDYVRRVPPNWDDPNGYLEAVNWLIKKDLVSLQNLDFLRTLDCLGEMKYYGVHYWLAEFERWHRDSPVNHQAHAVWQCVNANQSRIDEYIDELSEVGAQTVVHGDLHMSNILFGEDSSDTKLHVIDWTQPHISSVTKDLVSLHDNAPNEIRNELLRIYRKQIDFPGFDETFAKAKALRDIGYLSWLVWLTNEGQTQEVDQNELDRVAKSLLLALT